MNGSSGDSRSRARRLRTEVAKGKSGGGIQEAQSFLEELQTNFLLTEMEGKCPPILHSCCRLPICLSGCSHVLSVSEAAFWDDQWAAAGVGLCSIHRSALYKWKTWIQPID